MAKSKRVSPIPPGFRTVTPYLSVEGGIKALDFYKKVFGGKEITKWRKVTPDGQVIHARIKIGDTLIMLSDAMGRVSSDQGQVTLHLYSKNVDKVWKDALDAGAKAAMPLGDMYWGERYGQLVDPFGIRRSISMQIDMSKAERAQKEKEAMEMFAKGEHPQDK